jgi:hypothetical protein
MFTGYRGATLERLGGTLRLRGASNENQYTNKLTQYP